MINNMLAAANQQKEGSSLTGVVPAGCGSTSPGALKLGQSPLRDAVVAQSVGRQVTDLQLGVMTQEVREGHPARHSSGFQCSHRSPA